MLAWPAGMTGRVGRPVYRNELAIAEQFDLFDEVMKSVAYEIFAAGHKLVLVVGNEFLVEVPEAGVNRDDIATLARRAAGPLLGTVAEGCVNCGLARGWPTPLPGVHYRE
jgi:hypothetical protein